ncbi:MAG TPA: ribonuclease HII [Candidatus Paceibacterota bacterium]|nr:ribonuclease HII [Candidatus Paceibacterota bacterium]
MKKWIIGVDEVGRGPIAGPVMVCACAFNPDTRRRLSFLGLTDSKKMTLKAREAWFEKAKMWEEKGIIKYALAKRSSIVIDRCGISRAIKECVGEVLEKLCITPTDTQVLLDGSLYAPAEYTNQKTVIKGDAKHKEISLASVIAKVTRDRLMEQLHKKYPSYLWFKNKGYGTKEHFLALQKDGKTTVHRSTFLLKKGNC